MTIRSRSTHPLGFSLVELLIAMVVFSVVMGSVFTIILKQQRFYRGANDLMESRSQLRQGLSILPVDLRGISTTGSAGQPGGSDIYSLSPTALEVRVTYGSSILCNSTLSGGNSVIEMPPVGQLANGAVYSAFLVPASVGDTVFILDEGIANGGGDDVWVPHRVTATATSTTTCPATIPSALRPYVPAAHNGAARPTVTVTPAIGGVIGAGSAMRFTRRVRYSIYQAADNNWYLGYQDWNSATNAYNIAQPVAGPFLAEDTSTPTLSGLALRYYTTLGGQVTTNAKKDSVARIEVDLRGRTEGVIRLGGAGGAQKTDSLSIAIAIRNRT